ncbi:MAG: hypothetical protein ACREK2_07800 [Gemmatimonadota bacterium]
MTTSACTALVQRSVEPERVVRDEHPGWVVIGTTAGEELVLRTPQLQGDSLVVGSLVESIGDYPRPPDLVGIPLDEIAWVGTAEPDRIGEAKVLANAAAMAGFLIVPWIVVLVVGYK